MSTVTIPLDPGWYITYKSGNGRALAWPSRFATETQAQSKLDELGLNETMHVIEVTQYEATADAACAVLDSGMGNAYLHDVLHLCGGK